MVDSSRAVLALAAAALLYAAAGVCALRALARWLRRRSGGEAEEPASRTGRAIAWLSRGVLALAALGVLCLFYARFVEPFWPQVERVRIETAKLPAGARPVRLVLLADTHSDPAARLEGRLPRLVADLEPDAILFAGDAVNHEAGIVHFRACMRALAQVAPTYAVLGNWDVWYFEGADLFGGTGVTELDGEAVPVPAGAAGVWVAGAAFGRDGRVERAVRKVPAGRFSVLLYHSPEVVELEASRGADLVLVGDTHGGQVRLPLLGALVRLARGKRYYDIGLHRLGGRLLYVNRGLGMEGGRCPRVRFRCRPEITLIEIAPEEER